MGSDSNIAIRPSAAANARCFYYLPANHLFQTAKTGSIKEYGEIEETISPVALEKISGWILKLGVRAGAN